MHVSLEIENRTVTVDLENKGEGKGLARVGQVTGRMKCGSVAGRLGLKPVLSQGSEDWEQLHPSLYELGCVLGAEIVWQHESWLGRRRDRVIETGNLSMHQLGCLVSCPKP